MRVASRRLRAAMEVFEPCFPRKRYRAALKEVKAIADALGERRDRDVAIAALVEFGEELTATDRHGVLVIIDRLRDEQALANDRLVPFVDRRRLVRLRERIPELAAAAERGVRVKARRVKKLDPAAALDRNAARILRSRLEELRSFRPGAGARRNRRPARHADRGQAAALRDRGDRLLLRRARGGRAATGRELQDLLGEIHDCDVMTPGYRPRSSGCASRTRAPCCSRREAPRTSTPGWSAKLPTAPPTAGWSFCSSTCEARRALLFERFRDFWLGEAGTSTWANLQQAVEGPRTSKKTQSAVAAP